MAMESITAKLDKLACDLRNARLATRQQAYIGKYLGVGATVRVPHKGGTRLVGIYGSDVPNGIQINFLEDDQLIPDAHSIYRLTSRGAIVDHYSTSTNDPSIQTLRHSREFDRPELYFHRHQNRRTVVSRDELVFIDDALRHAISQAATYSHTQGSSKVRIFPQAGIRLPIKDFNKRLPDHTNAFRMWLEHRDLTLPPEAQRLASGQPYELRHLKGHEYEGGVAISIAGDPHDLANLDLYPDGPLIRMHSACSFSEKGRRKGYAINLERAAAFCQTLSPSERPFVPYIGTPSSTCDCRLQMEESQRLIAEEGGIFADFYEQEGRGYGLLNKEEFFYRLYEEEGWDTAEVCERYGINPDIRIYDRFIAWLQSLGVQRIRLLGNNPRKRKSFEKMGIEVIPIGLWLPTRGNITYLKIKRDRLEHDIPSDNELEEYMLKYGKLG